MKFLSAKIESLPFPSNGFQKYDVITPNDTKHYGLQYLVRDYQKVTYSNNQIEYKYYISCINGIDVFHNNYYESLNGFTKLYSKKREVILNIRQRVLNELELLEKSLEIIEKEHLGINTMLLSEAISQTKEFCRKLENTPNN